MHVTLRGSTSPKSLLRQARPLHLGADTSIPCKDPVQVEYKKAVSIMRWGEATDKTSGLQHQMFSEKLQPQAYCAGNALPARRIYSVVAMQAIRDAI
jgi:hypothetical protein